MDINNLKKKIKILHSSRPRPLYWILKRTHVFATFFSVRLLPVETDHRSIGRGGKKPHVESMMHTLFHAGCFGHPWRQRRDNNLDVNRIFRPTLCGFSQSIEPFILKSTTGIEKPCWPSLGPGLSPEDVTVE